MDPSEPAAFEESDDIHRRGESKGGQLIRWWCNVLPVTVLDNYHCRDGKDDNGSFLCRTTFSPAKRHNRAPTWIRNGPCTASIHILQMRGQ